MLDAMSPSSALEYGTPLSQKFKYNKIIDALGCAKKPPAYPVAL